MTELQKAELFGEIKYTAEGQAESLKLRNVILNYTFLDSPRPKDEYNDGLTRTTEVLLDSDEHVQLFTEYFQASYKQAAAKTWGGVQHQDIFLPYRMPKPHAETGQLSDIEKDTKLIIKTTSGFEVPLYNRDPETLAVTKLEGEDSIGKIYSGVLADIVIKLGAYDNKGARKAGLKGFVNSVCRVGIGKPQMQATNYADEFAVAGTQANDFAVAGTPNTVTVTKPAVEATPTLPGLNTAPTLPGLNTAPTTTIEPTPSVTPAGVPTAKEPLKQGVPTNLADLLKLG